MSTLVAIEGIGGKMEKFKEKKEKKVSYAMLVERKDEEERRTNTVRYKKMKKDAKLVDKTTKMIAFKHSYA